MCLPRYSAPFSSATRRQRERLAFTSRIPTVICVGLKSAIATGLRVGSRIGFMAAEHRANDPRDGDFRGRAIWKREARRRAPPYDPAGGGSNVRLHVGKTRCA